MHYNNNYTLCILALMLPATICGMDDEYRELYKGKQPEQSADTANGDLLWEQQRFSAVAAPQTPSTSSLLHDLIQDPQTHIADTQQLKERVEQLIQQFPHLLTTRDSQRNTALDLIMIQLQRANLTTQGQHNLEALKTVLEAWYSTIKRAAM
jgi:hypothetical protein